MTSTSKRASRLDLAKSFTEGNVTTSSKTSGFMAAMCLPITSRSIPIRSITSGVKARRSRRLLDLEKNALLETDRNPTSRKTRHDSKSTVSRSSPVDSAYMETDLIWPGNGSAPRIYPGLDKEDELWLADGDCLVFFDEPQEKTPPAPCLRVHSHSIRRADLAFLNQLLSVGKKRRRSSQVSFATQHVTSNIPEFPNVHLLSTSAKQLRRSSTILSDARTQATKSLTPLKIPNMGLVGNVSPQMKFNRSSPSASRFQEKLDSQPTSPTKAVAYEIWFAVPVQLTSTEQHRHKLAIRNLLAMLHNKSIVGTDIMRAIAEVQEIVVTFSSSKSFSMSPTKRMSWSHIRPAVDTNLVAAYVRELGFDDIRSNLSQALKLLAWSELPSVQWATGYVETFAHVVGMMSTKTLESHDFLKLSQPTRHNLRNAVATLELVVLEAEEKLRNFNFSQMWTLQRLGTSGARASFDGFSRFLNDFYSTEFGSWPPTLTRPGSQKWLTRTVVQRLQADFGALYEYLVDHNVEWNDTKIFPNAEPKMVNSMKRSFSADKILPVTDVLTGFDDFHGLSHVPHPFPLMPTTNSSSTRRGNRSTTSDHGKEASQIFTRASNVNSLKYHVDSNKLLQAFRHHESNHTNDSTTSPQEARLGRWVLLYGALQVLSLLSVDISGLRHTTSVPYFLCSPLTNLPPWNPEAMPIAITPSSQSRSYCWEAAEIWKQERKYRKDSAAVTSAVGRDDDMDEDKLTALSQRDPEMKIQMGMGSLISTSTWDGSSLAGYSPVWEGAARVMSVQYGIKGRLMDVQKGRGGGAR